jgi:hypothetical protein
MSRSHLKPASKGKPLYIAGLVGLCVIIIALYIAFCQFAPFIFYHEPFIGVVNTTSNPFGYREADVLLLDPNKIPDIGDVVYYDAHLDNPYSDQEFFGPPDRMARISGIDSPGVYITSESNDVFYGKKLIKREAIKGVVVLRLGHSDLYYDQLLQRVY